MINLNECFRRGDILYFKETFYFIIDILNNIMYINSCCYNSGVGNSAANYLLHTYDMEVTFHSSSVVEQLAMQVCEKSL